MNADYPNQAAPAWYAQRWPWLLMLGPALVIVAGALTTWLAISRPDAMVVDDYYKRGKTINQDLRRDRAASALRMAVLAQYDPLHGVLRGQLRSHGRPFNGPAQLRLTHATLPHKDLLRALRPDAQGRFAVTVGQLDRARWQVLVQGQDSQWRLAGGWRWPQTAHIAIAADGPAP